MKIVPALLTQDVDDYLAKLALVSTFTDFTQIDFMDGVFVPSRSIAAREAGGIDVPIEYEAHLMVSEPLEWARALAGPRLTRVIFHAEAVGDVRGTAGELRAMGLRPAVALNPPTPVAAVAGALPVLDAVLVMSVTPGFYGSPFIPEVLRKAAAVRKLSPSVVIGLDGGVGPDNIRAVRDAGFDYACVGSRIFLAPDPAGSFKSLSTLAV